MSDGLAFPRLVVRDALLAAAALAFAMLLWPGEGPALALATGACWACLNFYLLALLIVSVSGPREGRRLFIFALACAKIPASYYLLYWLYQVDYLEPVGLTAGISLVPVVLLFRGLLYAKTAGTTNKFSED